MPNILVGAVIYYLFVLTKKFCEFLILIGFFDQKNLNFLISQTSGMSPFGLNAMRNVLVKVALPRVFLDRIALLITL